MLNIMSERCRYCMISHGTNECPHVKKVMLSPFLKECGPPMQEPVDVNDPVRRWRQMVIRETMFDILNRGDDFYRDKAKENMTKWVRAFEFKTKYRQVSPQDGIYSIIELDWGECARRLTKIHGKPFAVLNFANASRPGGGYLSGCGAQEENMMRRTNLHFRLTNDHTTRDGKYYNKKIENTLNAVDNRVYVNGNRDDPDYVIRGPESDLYRFLEDDEIFPFIELRAAAINVYSVHMQQNDYENNTRKRIKAQFSTLMDQGIRHVVLGAFGCGAFGNKPEFVARCYVDEICRVRSSFDVIAFAIILSDDNIDAFSAAFEKIDETLLDIENQELLMGITEIQHV